jgi:hypothetical protein
MSEHRGPITLITDLSQKRNRWKALAFAWRSAAVSAIDACSVCGTPGLWRHEANDLFWCQRHYEEVTEPEREAATKLPWFAALVRALELEEELSDDQ